MSEIREAVSQLTINSNDLVKAMKEKDQARKNAGGERRASRGFMKDLWRRTSS